MFSKCRLALLGMVVAHGASLVAMDKKPESPRKLELSDSAELRNKAAAINIILLNKTSALSCSVELQKEKRAQVMCMRGFAVGIPHQSMI